MNSTHRPAVALSPAVLGSDWIRTQDITAAKWTGADLFLVNTQFEGDVCCPRDALRLCQVATQAFRLHFGVADQRDCVRAAAAYEQELRAHFNLPADELPCFDLVVTSRASDILQDSGESGRIAVARYSPLLRRSFVTLTNAVIRNARRHVEI